MLSNSQNLKLLPPLRFKGTTKIIDGAEQFF